MRTAGVRPYKVLQFRVILRRRFGKGAVYISESSRDESLIGMLNRINAAFAKLPSQRKHGDVE
jgi:hypothetical protein